MGWGEGGARVFALPVGVKGQTIIFLCRVQPNRTREERYEALGQLGQDDCGSNVIPRRVRPGLVGLKPHKRGPSAPHRALQTSIKS